MNAPFPTRRLPLTRGDCKNAPRPCPHASCRHHLLILAERRRGGLRLHPAARGIDPVLALEIMEETCSLDVAEKHPDGVTLDVLGTLLGITRERARQLEGKALRSVLLARRMERPER